MRSRSIAVAAGLVAFVTAKTIPYNVWNFYNRVKYGTCPRNNLLQWGLKSMEHESAVNTYCRSDDGSYIWIDGPPGSLTNMDVDCDGDVSNHASGRCGNDGSFQSQTAFRDSVRQLGISDLNSYKIPYVVLGNEVGRKFNPQRVGVMPLSVMAIVCNNQLFYGVWGDTNGGSLVGESSLSLATACYGTGMNGNRGHDANDVLYIAFTGYDAVPGRSANWRANNFEEFERSIEYLGDYLVSRIR